MRYKREKSCSPNGLQSFIDEITNGILDDVDLDQLKKNVLRRLKLCINDRLYEQQFIIQDNDEKNIENIRDHLNIIKSYYDLYDKLDKYFVLIAILIYTGKGRLKKLVQRKNIKHSILLEIFNGDNVDVLRFTDTSQNTDYLFDLDFSKNFHTSYNLSLLNNNTIDWSENEIIKDLQKLIESKIQLKFKSKKSVRKSRKTCRKSVRKSRKTHKKSVRKSRKRKSVKRNKKL